MKRITESGMHADGDGLYLRVRSTGARSWIFVSVRSGRRREMGLGATDIVSLAQARTLARKAKLAFEAGRDPIAERLIANDGGQPRAMSFGHFSTDLINGIEGGFRNEKHRKQWRSTLAAHAALLTDIPVDEISTDDFLKVLQPIWLKIPETASRVRSRIERILDAAKVLGHRHGENPARWKGHLEFILPKKGKAAVKHHAALPFGAMADFMAKLQRQDGVAAQALAFTILTAARSNETIGMTWREIDRDKRVWKISSSRTKSGTSHMVPLSEAASAVLDARRTGDAQPDDYVFEGPKGGPLSDMSMLMLLRRMQYGAITVHGFRSSFRDWAGELTEFEHETIEMALAHVVGSKAERAYRRNRALRKRADLMEAWACYCSGAPFAMRPSLT
ncbi:MAG: integrase arm-type DNA-binding domain-containing protein [Sphingomonas bacterium]